MRFEEDRVCINLREISSKRSSAQVQQIPAQRNITQSNKLNNNNVSGEIPQK